MMIGKVALMTMLDATPRMVAIFLGLFGAVPVLTKDTFDIMDTPLVHTSLQSVEERLRGQWLCTHGEQERDVL
jgi:hypothetical protein